MRNVKINYDINGSKETDVAKIGIQNLSQPGTLFRGEN